jgi:predicted RND superfamily exporter protein
MQGDIDATVAELKQKYPQARISTTGVFALMMKGADYMTEAAVSSFGSALVVISVVLLLVFGSLKAGLIAILPNLIPSILTFGLLGMFGIPLDFTTMMIAPIIIGIAVDDTVHFISQYQTNVRRGGDIVKALHATVKECGQAIAFTSLVLGLGFGILAIAEAPNTSNIGKFAFLSVMAGLLNDLFLLPALILAFKLDFKGRKPAAVPAGSGRTQQMAITEGVK